MGRVRRRNIPHCGEEPTGISLYDGGVSTSGTKAQELTTGQDGTPVG